MKQLPIRGEAVCKTLNILEKGYESGFSLQSPIQKRNYTCSGCQANSNPYRAGWTLFNKVRHGSNIRFTVSKWLNDDIGNETGIKIITENIYI